MADLKKLRSLAEARRRVEEKERLRQRSERTLEEEQKRQEKRKADEERYNRIISNIEYFTERAAREGKQEVSVMNIGRAGVENFQRTKRSFWRGGYEDHNVGLSQVTDDIARKVFAHCKREGLSPQIRWNPNNHSGSRDWEDDMFQLFVRW